MIVPWILLGLALAGSGYLAGRQLGRHRHRIEGYRDGYREGRRSRPGPARGCGCLACTPVPTAALKIRGRHG